MKSKTTVVILALSILAGAMCLASPQMGTWKLNEAKSKLDPSTGKNNTVTYESAGNKIKVTVDGTDANGKPHHDQWVGRFDGKDYTVTGDPSSDMRSYKQVNDHTMDIMVKKDGKLVATGQIVVAADGKSRTVKISGTTAKGKKFHSMGFYDRQ
jgi:hypothetical protein